MHGRTNAIVNFSNPFCFFTANRFMNENGIPFYEARSYFVASDESILNVDV